MMKKHISVILVWLAAIAVLAAYCIRLAKLIEFATSIGATSIESQELPIAEKYISVGHFGNQMTTFVVAFEEEEYTLPQVPTNFVRTYSEGDALPVVVYTYENGHYYLQVDTDALKAVEDKSKN